MKPGKIYPIAGLLALSACTQPPEDATTGAISAFSDIASESGLDFVHFNGMTGEHYFPEIQGPGVALFDYDNDGDLDVYLVQGNYIVPGSGVDDVLVEPVHPMPLRDRLYRNNLTADGQISFTDVTEECGIDAQQYGMGIATGDFDNDGWTDLYITNFGPNQLWHNNGDGTFSDVTDQYGANEQRWTHSAAFVDIDADDYLDLFIVNYVDFRIAGRKECPDATGSLDYCGPLAHRPEPDRLLHNQGGHGFVDITGAAGIREPGSGLGISTADFNADGRLDIYVANDAMPNRLWLNQGDRRFVDDALMRGTAVNSQGRAEASMGVDAGDFDQDGDFDLFMTHLREETNTLYINDGTGYFTDKTISAGLAASSMGLTGFGSGWLDIDRDGRLDLVVVNGSVRKVQGQVQTGSLFPYGQRNQFFRNTGSRFEPYANNVDALARPYVSRGVAIGDVDNDGDPDVLVTNNAGPVQLFINNSDERGHWLGVRLVGAGGRDMLGAKVILHKRNGLRLLRHARSDGSYLSANDPRVLFGLGADPRVQYLDVYWPGGRSERFGISETDVYLTLHQGDGMEIPSDAA